MKKKADSLTRGQLKGLIQGLADGVADAPAPGTVQLAESFNYAPAGSGEMAEAAMLTARRVIAHMYQGVRAAKAHAGERARFERWFGAMDPARYLTVCNNIAAVYTDITTRPLKLYYAVPASTAGRSRRGAVRPIQRPDERRAHPDRCLHDRDHGPRSSSPARTD